MLKTFTFIFVRVHSTQYREIVLESFFLLFHYELSCCPRPPAGAGGLLSRGPHRGLRVPGQLHALPGQRLCMFY